MPELSVVQRDLSELIVRVANLTHIKPEDINPEASLLRDGLGLDSIDLLELVVNIEKKYGFKLRNDEHGQIALSSLKNLSEYTVKQISGASARP